MSFLGHTFFSIFLVLCSASLCMQQDQPDFVVSWNKTQSFRTMSYSGDKKKYFQNKNSDPTLFLNGLISAECANRFNYIRFKSEYEKQYPGPYIISNGPVHNKETQWNVFRRLLIKIPVLKSIFRVSSALPYAFNYKEEASHMIQLLMHLNKHNTSIGCLQSICYGFHGIVCGIHALSSSDEKAQQVRQELGLTEDQAKNLLKLISLIIVQAPMMRISDSVECITKNVLCIMQLSCLAAILWLDYRQKIIHKNTITLLYGLSLLMNIVQFSTIAQEKIVSCITFFIMHYVIPFINPHFLGYRGDLSNLLQNLQLHNNFPDLTLLVTHQTDDQFVGPLKESDQDLLQKIFPKVLFVPSSKKGHLYESEEQKAVQNIIRKGKTLPYYEDQELLVLGEKWLKANPVKGSNSTGKLTVS